MNLILLSVVWLSTAFGYYLVLTLVNSFDKVYITGLTSSFSEIVGYILSGLFAERIGVKLSLVISFLISTAGGLLILVWGLQHQDSPLFFICFLLTKFGVVCTFNINFLANAYFFPTLFAATALGFVNFIARAFSSISFVVSRLEEPLPMLMFTAMVGAAAVSSLFLQVDDSKKTSKKDVQSEREESITE